MTKGKRSKPQAAPEELQGEALLAWQMFAADFDVEQADRATLLVLCHAWARLVDARANLDKTGTVIKLPNGYPGPSPFLKVAENAEKIVARLLAECGFTPAARAKLAPKIEAKADDGADLVF